MAFNKIFWAQKCSYNGKWLYYIDRSVYISHKREEKTLFTQFFLFKFCIEWTKYVRSIDERSTRYVNEKKLTASKSIPVSHRLHCYFRDQHFFLSLWCKKKQKESSEWKFAGKFIERIVEFHQKLFEMKDEDDGERRTRTKPNWWQIFLHNKCYAHILLMV